MEKIPTELLFHILFNDEDESNAEKINYRLVCKKWDECVKAKLKCKTCNDLSVYRCVGCEQSLCSCTSMIKAECSQEGCSQRQYFCKGCYSDEESLPLCCQKCNKYYCSMHRFYCYCVCCRDSGIHVTCDSCFIENTTWNNKAFPVVSCAICNQLTNGYSYHTCFECGDSFCNSCHIQNTIYNSSQGLCIAETCKQCVEL